MTRLRIAIRPWVKPPDIREARPVLDTRRTAFAAVAIVVAIAVLLLSGCGSADKTFRNREADALERIADRLDEWDRYGCGRE